MGAAGTNQTTRAIRLPALAILLAGVTVLAYLPALRCGYIWDDDIYVTQNHALQTVDGLGRIWIKPGTTPQYYPLVFTTFWAEYHLWRLQPLGYHLDNILLHAANALLLWWLLRRLQCPGAWWAAAIFAVHPVHVESVAWITERKNVLSGFFYFLAVLAYLRFRPLTGGEAARPRDWRVYPLVLALFVCALLSKTVTCSLPAALILLIWWKTGRVGTRDVLELAPLFALGAASGFMTAWMEQHTVGATGANWALSSVQRCLVAGRALWFYAAKLLWPLHLTFNYPRWELDATAAWQFAFPLAALGVLLALWSLRSRIGKGPLVAVLFFAGTLLPALGFFNVFPFRYSYVADHFQYLASVGLIALAVAACVRLREHTNKFGRPAGPIATGILIWLGTLTWHQQRAYTDPETLWRDTLAKNPQSWLAHNNLGLALSEQGQTDEAVAHYQQALRIAPEYPETRVNLGNVFFRDGNIPAAIAQFEQALATSPDYAQAHNNLGSALFQMGHLPEAIAHYQQALQINPNFAQAHNALGLALFQLGEEPEAVEHFTQAVRLEPDFSAAHSNLGSALARQGKVAEAIDHFEQAVQLDPNDAALHHKLAIALLQVGRFNDAITHLTLAIRLNPNDADAHANLGVALSRVGRIPEAIDHFQQAVRLNPDFADAHYNLAMVLGQIGRVPEAIDHLQQTLRIKPDLIAAQTALARLQSRQ
jgi:tetratricopeptide (TPR) repeat protein